MARRILIGTTNPSKIVWLKSYLADLSGIETVTLTDLGVTAPVSEEGRTPEENARIKALSYHQATGLAVVGHDSGLYFQEFSMDDPRQPGLFIRRVNGQTLDDDGMLAYYSRLAQDFGPLHACYCSGFAAVDETGRVATFAQDSVSDKDYFSTFGFLMVGKPHRMRRPGWPLDSLSQDPRTGEYWYDQEGGRNTIEESDYSRNYRQNVNRFFTNFFQNK